MGYFTEVALAIKSEQYQKCNGDKICRRAFNTCDVEKEINNDHFLYWESIKWYGHDVSHLLSMLSCCGIYEDYYCVMLGEEYGDQGILGGWFSNPFKINVEQIIRFIDDEEYDENISLDELKVRNSHPSAKNCARCGGELKNPLPGIKFCPICEP